MHVSTCSERKIWKKNKKTSKYYENDRLLNFCSLFMNLSTAEIVKNSHIYTGSDFIFLNIALKQISKTVITKCQHHLQNRKSSYQVTQILALF